ncbi:MAG: polysaccharide biosynthesis protein [Novosphingobium sp.]|uniref:oligosaccharide flippase family protein n=1 Tax=Novosphingobium sp. TaxID=1874826 RepID=UPI0012C72E82|nr:oligosaccharide flippase family protein [Novosphingobium sp.]MPS68635.1 polysaccharide biosynthesis protein [Novosphingobium sp.]
MSVAVLRRANLRIVRNRGGFALFAFSARALEQVSTLVITLLAARFLEPADFGVFSLANVFVILVQTLTYTGIFQFVLVAKAEDSLVVSTCFWLILALVGAASLFLAAIAFPLEWLFGAKELGLVLLLLAMAQPVASIVAWSSATLLRRQAVALNFKFVFVENLVALISGAILLWYWHSLYALVAARYVRILFGAVLFVVAGRTWPMFKFSMALARKATVFSSHLYGSRFLAFLARYAGDVMLGLFHSPADVGLYRFGNRIATGATDILTQPMSNFAATQFGNSARQEQDLAGPLARFSGTVALLTGMAGAVIIVFGRDIVSAFFQPSYLAALVVTYAMSLRGVAGAGQLLVEPAFAALDRTHWVMMFNLIAAALSVAAILIATPFGIAALAWSQAFVVLITTIWGFHLIRWKGHVRVGLAVRNFIAAGALALAYFLMLYALRHCGFLIMSAPPITTLVIGLLASAMLGLVFLAMAYRLRIFSLEVFSG